MVWTNFKNTMCEHYGRMLAERGGGTLAEDEYKAFNAIATKDMAALTKSTVTPENYL